jgi:hypothetical protein
MHLLIAYMSQHILHQHKEMKPLTSINVLVDRRLYYTLVHGSNVLALERLLVLASLEHAAIIHGLLQAVVIPYEDVISMRAVPLVVTVRQEEGIGAVLGPHVVELRRVPKRLVGDLRQVEVPRPLCDKWTWTSFWNGTQGWPEWRRP